MTIDSTVSKRYAKALFLVAKEGGKIDEIFGDLKALIKEFKSFENFKDMIVNKVVPSNIKSEILSLMMKKINIHDEMSNFIKLLINNNRVSLFFEISSQFHLLYNKEKNIQNVKIVTARPCNDNVIKSIKKEFTKVLNSKDLEFEFNVNKKILGGIIVEVGSKMMDLCFLSKINKLRDSVNKI
ncbi:MAG: F-type H+-transporting ATPase subunit delta [Candidatus Midichloriaceae bacterium]|jgi:F-type H+-transporting ATPase subunit delta